MSCELHVPTWASTFHLYVGHRLRPPYASQTRVPDVGSDVGFVDPTTWGVVDPIWRPYVGILYFKVNSPPRRLRKVNPQHSKKG